jgi:hypothetical protein
MEEGTAFSVRVEIILSVSSMQKKSDCGDYGNTCIPDLVEKIS